MSVDWQKMGILTADFILSGKPIQVGLPTEVNLRGSLYSLFLQTDFSTVQHR